MSSRPRSYLFTLRIWMEDVSDGQTEWRGRLRFGLHGETRHFRSWLSLIEYLKEFLTPAADIVDNLTLDQDEQAGQNVTSDSVQSEEDRGGCKSEQERL